MERDESVPLTFERDQDQEGGMQAMPEGMQRRRAEVADVVDLTAMIADLEASTGRGGR
jgi:hypothetical protein